MTGGWQQMSHDQRVLILRDAALHIRGLESAVLAERERADRMRDGYARLMEQAAEIIGEAARITQHGETRR